MFTAFTRMVSRGKHSRGNWVLLIRSWLVSSAVPPVPNDWAKKVQHRIPMKAKIGYGIPGGIPNALVREKMRMKMPSMATGAIRAQSQPQGGLLVLGPDVPFGQRVDDVAARPQVAERRPQPGFVVVDQVGEAARPAPSAPSPALLFPEADGVPPSAGVGKAIECITLSTRERRPSFTPTWKSDSIAHRANTCVSGR